MKSLKKNYISPCCVEMELESMPLMVAASSETGNTNVGSGSVGNKNPDLSSRSRGEWGNIWQ